MDFDVLNVNGVMLSPLQNANAQDGDEDGPRAPDCQAHKAPRSAHKLGIERGHRGVTLEKLKL